MTARNPGPFLQQTPIGFPSYCRNMNRDWMRRKAFQNNEVNLRVMKSIYENVGVRGRIDSAKISGRGKIHLRGITEGYGKGVQRWTKMNKHGFMQTWREGWFVKYGLDPHRFHRRRSRHRRVPRRRWWWSPCR